MKNISRSTKQAKQQLLTSEDVLQTSYFTISLPEGHLYPLARGIRCITVGFF